MRCLLSVLHARPREETIAPRSAYVSLCQGLMRCVPVFSPQCVAWTQMCKAKEPGEGACVVKNKGCSPMRVKRLRSGGAVLRRTGASSPPRGEVVVPVLDTQVPERKPAFSSSGESVPRGGKTVPSLPVALTSRGHPSGVRDACAEGPGILPGACGAVPLLRDAVVRTGDSSAVSRATMRMRGEAER